MVHRPRRERVAARRTHAAANRPSCVSLQSANHGCFSPSLQLIFEFPGQRDVWEVCSMGSDSTHRGDSMPRGESLPWRGPHIRTNIANAIDTSCGSRAAGRRLDAHVERVVHLELVSGVRFFDCFLPFMLGRCSRCLCLLRVRLTNIELVLNDLGKCLTFATRRICGVTGDSQSVQLHAPRVSRCRPHERCGEWNKLGRALAHRLK